MNVTVKIDDKELVEGLYRERNYVDLLDLVLKLDLRIADCSFTEKLIKVLMESLASDSTKKDGYRIISELESIVSKNFMEDN